MGIRDPTTKSTFDNLNRLKTHKTVLFENFFHQKTLKSGSTTPEVKRFHEKEKREPNFGQKKRNKKNILENNEPVDANQPGSRILLDSTNLPKKSIGQKSILELLNMTSIMRHSAANE